MMTWLAISMVPAVMSSALLVATCSIGRKR